MKRHLLLVVVLMMVGLVGTQPVAADDVDDVKEVIISAYIDGLQNLGDIEDIERGFHPGFALLYIEDNRLEKLTLYNWLERVKQRKAENPNGPEDLASIEFLDVDVFGKSAVAQFDMFRGGKKVFTDAFFLLKFDEGWRVVSKISHRH